MKNRTLLVMNLLGELLIASMVFRHHNEMIDTTVWVSRRQDVSFYKWHPIERLIESFKKKEKEAC